MYKAAVTTLMTLAYSGWLSNKDAMLTQVVAEGVAVAKRVISKMVLPSGEKAGKPLYFTKAKMMRLKQTREKRLLLPCFIPP